MLPLSLPNSNQFPFHHNSLFPWVVCFLMLFYFFFVWRGGYFCFGFCGSFWYFSPRKMKQRIRKSGKSCWSFSLQTCDKYTCETVIQDLVQVQLGAAAARAGGRAGLGPYSTVCLRSIQEKRSKTRLETSWPQRETDVGHFGWDALTSAGAPRVLEVSPARLQGPPWTLVHQGCLPSHLRWWNDVAIQLITMTHHVSFCCFCWIKLGEGIQTVGGKPNYLPWHTKFGHEARSELPRASVN